MGFVSFSTEWCWFWYWPDGVNSRLPSGVKVRRRKNEVRVSLAYRLAFFMPAPIVDVMGWGFGEASIGMTAGRGMDGAGDSERREEKDDLRLWLTALGGFIGRLTEVGVPGAEGTGDPMDGAESTTESCAR